MYQKLLTHFNVFNNNVVIPKSEIPQTSLQHDEGEWLGNDDDPLQGFPWRGGSEADTVGIYLWSQAFITTLDNGQEVAVLLMDTQVNSN